jgi:hypothetical protein
VSARGQREAYEDDGHKVHIEEHDLKLVASVKRGLTRVRGRDGLDEVVVPLGELCEVQKLTVVNSGDGRYFGNTGGRATALTCSGVRLMSIWVEIIVDTDCWCY